MIFLYITVSSITTAARLKKRIEASTGYPAEIVHTPSRLNTSGECSYAVRADNRLAEIIKPLCDESGIRIKKIYAENIRNGERVFDEIFG